MLATIIQWCYLFFLTYAIGCAFSKLFGRLTGYCMKNTAAYLMTGLCALTAYVQFFSIFGKVGILANLIILIAAILAVVYSREKIAEEAAQKWKGDGMAVKLAAVCLFVLWAYFTSRGEMVYDTGLYHAQSIRWIEEYGVVKGLGNLHNRFAYNSSIFCLYALFSMRFLTGGIPLHTVNGFFAFVLSLALLEPVRRRGRRDLRLSDFTRLVSFYYLTMIIDEVISPSSDYGVMCVVLYIVVTWLELLENNEKSAVPYGLLCVLGVYAVTLKLTAGLILILVLKPAVKFLKEKKYKEIALFLVTGLLVALPWMVRTVIISGWLLYPLPSLDLFDFDWKMPYELTKYDADSIKVLGRGLTSVEEIKVPVTQWFKNWFKETLSGTEKILIVSDIAALPYLLVMSVKAFCKREEKQVDVSLVALAAAASYLYWQLNAPLLRYGYAYVLLIFALGVGQLLLSWDNKTFKKTVIGVMIVFAAYKAAWMGKYIIKMDYAPYYIWQRDYDRFELLENNVDGQIIYTPLSGDLTGYYQFPAAPGIHLKRRGDSLADGFLCSFIYGD